METKKPWRSDMLRDIGNDISYRAKRAAEEFTCASNWDQDTPSTFEECARMHCLDEEEKAACEAAIRAAGHWREA